MSLKVIDYSPKSFVITGETMPHKDNLKRLGGKWNSRLKCKDSDEVFGGWIFWMNKKEEVLDWMDKGYSDVIVSREDAVEPTTMSKSSGTTDLENRVVLLEKQTRDLEELLKVITQKLRGFIVEETGEEYSQEDERPKRLLKK